MGRALLQESTSCWGYKSRTGLRSGHHKWPAPRVLLTALLVFIGCYVGAASGILLQFPVVGTAVLFPPYAVLAAALLLTPVRKWWVMVLAAAVGNYWPHYDHERSISFVLIAEVANAARALTVAGGLRLLCRKPGHLGTLGDMAIFLTFAAVLGPAVGAFVGAADVTLHNPAAGFWLAWQAWLLSNTLIGLTLLPMILTAGSATAWLENTSSRRLVEGAVLSLGLIAVGIYVLNGSQDQSSLPAYLYGPLPFLLWAAVRFGTGGTISALSAMTVLTIYGAINGHGPFVTQSAADNLLQLQLYLIAISAPILLLAAVVEQNARAAIELQRSREQYRSVVEDQTELICRFQNDGTYTFVNGAYCRYFNRTPEELLGGTFWKFIPEKAHQATREFLDSITIEHPVATIEHEVLRPGGEVRWHQWTDRGLFDASGRLVEYQAVGRDVTDVKRAEEEHRLLESQRRVEEALRETDRRKDEFLAILAHELRNPLAPISTAVEMMRRYPSSSTNSAFAQDIIARQVAQITRLVDDLMDISRITLGKIQLKMETVDLSSAVAQAVESSRALIEQRRHQLTLSLPQAPVYVRGDTVRLGQIIANLLNNAAKYTEPGGWIELSVTHDGTQVTLSVRDNGAGIAPDMLESVFDLFTQGHGKFDAAQGGLGIGLTLVKRLLELHGGRIEAFSAGPGQGSEFTVRLPALAGEELRQESPVQPSTPEDIPLRILVVDDNNDAANCLAGLLAAWGHTVCIARDGVAAIEMEAAFAPNAVLLDLGLPGVDGLEVARRLRHKCTSKPLLLVAITGFGQLRDRRRTAEAGFDQHFTKPVDVNALRSLLYEWADDNAKTA